MALKILEAPPDRPQVPSCPPEIRRRPGDTGRDLGIEADTEAVVERDPVNLRRIDYADFSLDEYPQRPPQIRAHPKSLDVVVTAASGQHAHGPARSGARRRYLVNRTVSTGRHPRRLFGQTVHDTARVARPTRNVPDRPQTSLLEEP